ncbi:MAG: hypothetical protein HRU69_06945 [Flammeovirgaceae bacterium]|nr:MAG: hypothetical protein HRU69_06945 [Flammeovirgaceae bacterium]
MKSTSLNTLKRIFLPGIILQSVLIGGGYATGREIVEYGGKFGANGWLSGLAIFAGFSIMSILSMEACRQWKVYDYKSLLKKMIGRGWIVYEAVYLSGSILIIAVMAAAAGELLHNTLGINNWFGISIIIITVGFLNYKGDETIAKLETLGTIALFITYFLFAASIFNTRGEAIAETFRQWNTSFTGTTASVGVVLTTGILYVGYNLGVYPASFFTYRAIETRRQSVAAGLLSGLLMTTPWFLTYFAMMAFYAEPEILQSAVPWLAMLQNFPPAYIILFSIVVGWTLIETATGVIHGFIGRIDAEAQSKGRQLKKGHKALISLTALIAALFLSQVGIIDLVAKGYTLLAYGLIAVYALPLLAYSPWLFKSNQVVGD